MAVVAAAALLPALPSGVNAAAARPSAAAGAGAAALGGSWGNAEEVPGTAALNTGGSAAISSVSCASAGNCSAGGFYAGDSGQQVFVVSQKKDRWGKAEEVPGIAALNTGGLAVISSVSCASAGNCSAGGQYSTLSSGNFAPFQAFVISQRNGRWGNAEEVPGTAALNSGAQAEVYSVSCASAGNCSAGGYYTDSSGEQSFVVSQANGNWGKAEKVPGLAAISTMGNVNSVSCTSAGNCVAGGYFVKSVGANAFVVSQKKGTWGKALEISRMGSIGSLSCPSAGNCSAGSGGIVVSQKDGTWGKAEEVPGLAALNKGGHAFITSVSCASAGYCSVGGYSAVDFQDQGFVVSQKNSTWGNAEEVPGLAALNKGESAFVISVSCGSAGNCSAGGFYSTTPHQPYSQAFVVSQDKGSWGNAKKIPGLAALDTGRFAVINSVSCASAGNCSVGGLYSDRSHHSQAFVVSQAR